MKPRVWSTTDDDTIECVSLTPHKLSEAIDVLKKSFIINENVCVALKFNERPKAVDEIDELFLYAALDGVSIIAVEKATGKIVGVSFNKMEFPDDNFEVSMVNIKQHCKESSSKALLKWMADVTYNFHSAFSWNSTLEIMFLTTLSEFRGKGIAQALFKASILLSEALLTGENVKISINGKQLTNDKPPKAVVAYCTSFVTQKIVKKFGFIKVDDISYDEFSFEGEPFSKYIQNTPSVTREYKPLMHV